MRNRKSQFVSFLTESVPKFGSEIDIFIKHPNTEIFDIFLFNAALRKQI